MSIQIEAYAKINLGLDVLRRLENGYHEVKMVMQSVGISDTVTLRKIPEGIRLLSEDSNIPADDTNLAYRAAKLFMEEAKKLSGKERAENTSLQGVEISLIKRIPVAAGMAGGSSDAAAVLKGMNELFETGFSLEKLMEIGVKIGADVPYCLLGGTAKAEGIGEKLTPLKRMKNIPVLVVKPDIFVSTKEVYESLRLNENTVHPDIDQMVNIIESGQADLNGLIGCMGNVLQPVTQGKYPIVGNILAKMKNAGAACALMSGSGPSVFGIFASRDLAERAKEAFAEFKEVFVTEFV